MQAEEVRLPDGVVCERIARDGSFNRDVHWDLPGATDAAALLTAAEVAIRTKFLFVRSITTTLAGGHFVSKLAFLGSRETTEDEHRDVTKFLNPRTLGIAVVQGENVRDAHHVHCATTITLTVVDGELTRVPAVSLAGLDGLVEQAQYMGENSICFSVIDPKTGDNQRVHDAIKAVASRLRLSVSNLDGFTPEDDPKYCVARVLDYRRPEPDEAESITT